MVSGLLGWRGCNRGRWSRVLGREYSGVIIAGANLPSFVVRVSEAHGITRFTFRDPGRSGDVPAIFKGLGITHNLGLATTASIAIAFITLALPCRAVFTFAVVPATSLLGTEYRNLSRLHET
jgi:hypothetical protein